MGCLTVGTVPLFKMHLRGTVPALKKLNIGILLKKIKSSQKSEVGVGREGREWLTFPVLLLALWTGGNNRKKARIAQMRVGTKAGTPAPGSPVRVSFS